MIIRNDLYGTLNRCLNNIITFFIFHLSEVVKVAYIKPLKNANRPTLPDGYSMKHLYYLKQSNSLFETRSYRI